jgi:hypothetical protein
MKNGILKLSAFVITLCTEETSVQTKKIFPATSGSVNSLSILAGHQFKEHITRVPVFFNLCFIGNPFLRTKMELLKHGVVGLFNIEPSVKHKGIEAFGEK